MTAEDERAAVVAWLREQCDIVVGALCQSHGYDIAAADRDVDLIENIAARIERGDHITPGGRVMAHKDLSDEWRDGVEFYALMTCRDLFWSGQSLALAREAWINAFDKAASELEATDAQNEA